MKEKNPCTPAKKIWIKPEIVILSKGSVAGGGTNQADHEANYHFHTNSGNPYYHRTKIQPSISLPVAGYNDLVS